MNGPELRRFSDLQIITKIAYLDLSRNLQVDEFSSLSSLTEKLWKSVQMMTFNCEHDLQVFSWWIELNKKVLIIFKFWPISYTRTLEEISKVDKFFRFVFIHF